MNKRKKEAANMFFSAFLVLAYVICAYFLIQLSRKLTNSTLMALIIIAVVAGFGLFLFYATRVGDGKQIMRFSPSVLILMVLPSLYVICAFFAVGLPLHEQIVDTEQILYLAAITLGYSIPYTFTSGFEIVSAEDVYYPKDEEEKPDGEDEVTDDDGKEVKNEKNEKNGKNSKNSKNGGKKKK